MQSERHQAKNFVLSCILVGMKAQAKVADPKGDLITQRMAYKRHGEAKIKELEGSGLLNPKRKGKKENSPIYYSELEITIVLASEYGIIEGFINPLINNNGTDRNHRKAHKRIKPKS